MSPQLTPAAPANEDAAYYRSVLHNIIDMAADLACQAHAAATRAAQPGQDAANPSPDHTIAFDRMARAVRRTIALAQHIARPAAAAAPTPQFAARRRILREVEDAIARTTTGDHAERLHAETLDRLDRPDLDDDIGHLPTATIIADICRDLGIAAPEGAPRPWKRRTPDDIALLHARAAGPPQTPAPGNAPALLLVTKRRPHPS